MDGWVGGCSDDALMGAMQMLVLHILSHIKICINTFPHTHAYTHTHIIHRQNLLAIAPKAREKQLWGVAFPSQRCMCHHDTTLRGAVLLGFVGLGENMAAHRTLPPSAFFLVIDSLRHITELDFLPPTPRESRARNMPFFGPPPSFASSFLVGWVHAKCLRAMFTRFWHAHVTTLH